MSPFAHVAQRRSMTVPKVRTMGGLEDTAVSGERTCGTPDSELPVAWETIDRYYAGEATRAETVTVRAYLAEHPACERVFTQLLQKLGSPITGATEAPIDTMLTVAHERMLPANAIKRVVRTLFTESTERAFAVRLDLGDPELDEDKRGHFRHLIEQAKREGQ